MPKTPQQDGQVNWIKDKFKPLQPKPKGWFTLKEIMQISGNSRSVVQDRLEQMIKEGEIQVIECLENGHRMKAYGKK